VLKPPDVVPSGFCCLSSPLTASPMRPAIYAVRPRRQSTCWQSFRQTPLQWVIVALVKALNVVAIEALGTDLHPGTQRAHGRQFLDTEPDRLRCGRKAATA